LVLRAELASVRALFVKGVITSTSHPFSNLCAMCLPCCTHNTYRRRTYRRRTRAHTHTHTQTPTVTQQHMHTTPLILEDNVLRQILQHHSCDVDAGDALSSLDKKTFITTAVTVRYGTRLGDLKESWFILFSNQTFNTHTPPRSWSGPVETEFQGG
jgi:hypothetical protein